MTAPNQAYVTLTLRPKQLVDMHAIAAAARDLSVEQGLPNADDMRDAARKIESALRSCGWAPTADGTWRMRTGARR